MIIKMFPDLTIEQDLTNEDIDFVVRSQKEGYMYLREYILAIIASNGLIRCIDEFEYALQSICVLTLIEDDYTSRFEDLTESDPTQRILSVLKLSHSIESCVH